MSGKQTQADTDFQSPYLIKLLDEGLITAEEGATIRKRILEQP